MPYPDLSTPIPGHQNHFRAPNAKPEPSGSILSQLASNTSPNPLTPLHLSNALPNTPTPLRLVDAFPTQRTFDLSSPSRQVNSRHPHSFPTRCLSTFTLLCQVYSRHLIGLTTAVGRSPIAYLPRSMRLSPSFLALSIYVHLLFCCMFLCHITRYSLLVFYVSSSVPHLCLPLFHLSLFLTSVAPTLVIPYISYDPLIINFDTPRPSSAPPVNHGLIALAHLTPSSTCTTFPTTQQSPLDKAQLKAMDA